MKVRLKRLAIGLAAGLVLAAPFAAHADDDDEDHDVARELYEHGEIRALSEILPMVGKRTPGDVVAVDLVEVGEPVGLSIPGRHSRRPPRDRRRRRRRRDLRR